MAAEVVEVAALAGDGRIDTPGPAAAPALGAARRPEEPDADGADIAHGALAEQLGHLQVHGQAAAVVGDEEGHPGAAAGLHHLLALGGGARHRLLHVDGLSGGGGAQRVLRVGVRRRGHVHGVDALVLDQGPGVVVPARHPVAPGVVPGLVAVAPHDGGQLRVAGLPQPGARLHLGHVAAADDAPAHRGRVDLHRTPPAPRVEGARVD